MSKLNHGSYIVIFNFEGFEENSFHLGNRVHTEFLNCHFSDLLGFSLIKDSCKNTSLNKDKYLSERASVSRRSALIHDNLLGTGTQPLTVPATILKLTVLDAWLFHENSCINPSAIHIFG